LNRARRCSSIPERALTSAAEYVELLNISDAPVTLYNAETSEPWRFMDDPTNPGLDYFFPSDTPITVAAGEYILLVRRLTDFNSEFSAPGGTQILEWLDGRLSNGGEKIQLSMPGDVDAAGRRQYIRVDRVNYSDDLPWPTAPDNSGPSLARITPAEYGNDVANWQAATPSPGGVNP
jgi:hypothetical protein